MAKLTADMLQSFPQQALQRPGEAFKGDFSHWHHEMFPATEDNLVRYLQPPDRLNPVAGLRKLDPSGYVVK